MVATTDMALMQWLLRTAKATGHFRPKSILCGFVYTYEPPMSRVIVEPCILTIPHDVQMRQSLEMLFSVGNG